MGCCPSKNATVGTATVHTALEEKTRPENLTVEIQTGVDNYGLVDINFDLTLYHSDCAAADSLVKETTVTKLHKFTYSRFTTLGKKSGYLTFHVIAPELIGNHIYAIALNNKLKKEWYFEAITVKRDRDGKTAQVFYFPVFSWIVEGPRRIFFFGAHTPDPKVLPPKILELRAEDIGFWQSKYNTQFKQEGLPVGHSAETKTLFHDEKISYEKGNDFDYHVVKALAHGGILQLLTRRGQMFKSFAEIDKLLYMVEKKPDIAYHWQEDTVFGAQVVSGVNPVMIRAIPAGGEFPDTFPARIGEKLEKTPCLAGKDVKEELRSGHFSYVDYSPYLEKFVDKINSDCAGIGEDETKHRFNGYMASPVGLFWHDKDHGKIYPVAIRVVKDGDVFYPPPSDEKDDIKLNQWILAKMWFGLGDANVHQFSTHLLRTHLVIETFDLSMARQLSPHHPIYKILKHHFRSTMSVNATARERLINLVMKIFSMGDCILDFLKHSYSQWKFFEDNNPIKQLEQREFTGKSGNSLEEPGQYPWAEDSRDLFTIIHNFVKEYIDIYYESDISVAQDEEVQNWIKEADEFNWGDKGVPKSIETKELLTEVIAVLIWTTTAQHSSVNFSQYTYTSYSPNRVSKSHRPPLKSYDEKVDQTYLMESLPTIAESARLSGIVAALSSYEPKEVFIGKRACDLHGPSQVKEKKVFAAFAAALKAYGKRVEERNNTLVGRKESPYIWLTPQKITNSIAI
ncbi:Lipoxygenase [Rhizoclosmatium globosum]|uniref:Manganese lipoxygenase n=1 Tax=Rhizoclosmatium globosum TaxID=329046 RepID=A0A1Y2B0V8_9FUNG|nr:Lipoxygenase [Rhizoclosmatium globosum]|eukprot:ORY28366.1 Lipoxygenase [Rhizoclosmatium globosum]